MRIALFGRNGQVATAIRQVCAPGSLEVIGRDRADFSDPAQVADAARSVDADVFVNAVAYTAVDRAESEPELAQTVNGTSVGRLAEVAAARGIPLVHLSTDYIFDGTGNSPWTPRDAPAPLGVYGASKLAGERAIATAGARAVVLRTSWVFSATGTNFVKTMLRLGAERDRLTVVSDQIGGPTAAHDIADAVLAIAAALHAGHQGGTFHFAGAPDTSWADFAREIFTQSGTTCEVADIPTSAYPTAAIRPLNSRLNCSATEAAFGLTRPDWRSSLASVLAELVERNAHERT